MAGQSPAPLPSLGLLLDPSSPNVAGSPAFIPSIGLMFGASGGHILGASAGSFALTGIAAALKSGRKVASATGSFSETGVASTLTKASIGGGGDPAPLPHLGLTLINDPTHKVVFATTGQFVLTGVASSLLKGRGIAAGIGSYLLNGAPALRDMQVTADKATFANTSNAATLTRASQGITANVGSFTMTGFPVGLVYQTATGKSLSAAFGQFVLTGNDATLPTTIARQLLADRGSFAMTGSGASFVAVHWAPQNQPSSTWTDVAGSSTTWTPT